jgi:asparagine synthase (glutamine-hydrolysing)
MLGHLGLSDWQVLTIRSELDALGPTARGALSKHGLYWPGNAHTTIPMLRAAGVGSLVTGNGGDETFSYLVRRVKPSIRRAVRALPPRQAVVYVPLLLLPESARTRLVFRRGIRLPWLRPGARREVVRRFVAASLEPKGTPRDELRKLHASRLIEVGRGVQTRFERDTGAKLFEPFLDLRFLEAAAASTPSGGFASRGAALEAFFGDLMPPEITRRGTKASFTEALWGPDSRAFAEAWDGSGLDSTLVDATELRRAWARPKPDLRSVTPLQAAWLASNQSISSESHT